MSQGIVIISKPKSEWKKNYKLAWAVIILACTLMYYWFSMSSMLDIEGLVRVAPAGSINANYLGYYEYHVWMVDQFGVGNDNHTMEHASSYYEACKNWFENGISDIISYPGDPSDVYSKGYYDIITDFDAQSTFQKRFQYSIHFFSFFTIQSTIFVLIWLFVGVKHHEKEGKSGIQTNTWALAVTIFIVITGIVYCIMILPANLPESAGEWFVKLTLHVVSPIVFTTYYLFIMERPEPMQSSKSLFSGKVWMLFIYTIGFGLISIIYGTIRNANDHMFAFQYEFLNVVTDCPYILGGTSGWILLFIAFIFSSTIILAGAPIFNTIAKKYNDKKSNNIDPFINNYN